MSDAPAVFELWFESAKQRLDRLWDECRENAALCDVDSAEGQQWIKLADELESIASDIGVPAMYEIRKIFEGKKLLLMDKTHVEDEHKPFTEISFGMVLGEKMIFAVKDTEARG